MITQLMTLVNLRDWARRAAFGMLSLFYGYLVSIFTFFSMVRHRRSYFQVRRREIQPTCLKDPSHGEHFKVKIDDVVLHYVAKGDPDNDLLLFIHGFPDFWFTWRNQMSAFEKHYSVALDLRGFSESDRLPFLNSYQFESILRDVKGLIHSLGKERVVLVGHDMGGCIAALFAQKNPSLVNKLVLINSTHLSLYSSTLLTDWRQFFSSWQIFFFQLYLLPEFVILGKDFAFLENTFRSPEGRALLDEEELEAYKYTFARPGAVTCALNYFRANIDSVNHCDEEVKIAAPTLMIYGNDDPTLSPKVTVQSELSKFFSSIQVQRIPKTGHYAHIEDPRTVSDLIHKFIS